MDYLEIESSFLGSREYRLSWSIFCKEFFPVSDWFLYIFQCCTTHLALLALCPFFLYVLWNRKHNIAQINILPERRYCWILNLILGKCDIVIPWRCVPNIKDVYCDCIMEYLLELLTTIDRYSNIEYNSKSIFSTLHSDTTIIRSFFRLTQ